MTTLQVSTQNQLRQLVEQIERLEEEKKALAGDIRDKFLEAKAVGFDVKALRKIVSLRKKSKADRDEEEAISRPTCMPWACWMIGSIGRSWTLPNEQNDCLTAWREIDGHPISMRLIEFVV